MEIPENTDDNLWIQRLHSKYLCPWPLHSAPSTTTPSINPKDYYQFRSTFDRNTCSFFLSTNQPANQPNSSHLLDTFVDNKLTEIILNKGSEGWTEGGKEGGEYIVKTKTEMIKISGVNIYECVYKYVKQRVIPEEAEYLSITISLREFLILKYMDEIDNGGIVTIEQLFDRLVDDYKRKLYKMNELRGY